MCKFAEYHEVNGKIAVWKCGVCDECRREKRLDYVVRSYLELFRDVGYSPKFATFTYDQPNYYRALHTRSFVKDFQKFMKRLRKHFFMKFGKYITIRYLRVCELGKKTGRFHWHVIFFNLPWLPISKLTEIWSYGKNNWITSVGEKITTKDGKEKKCTAADSINYVCKYITKPTDNKDFRKKFGVARRCVCSTFLGVINLPKSKLIQYIENPFLPIDGRTYRLPGYIKKHWFESDETDSEIFDKYINQKNNYKHKCQQELEKRYGAEPWFARGGYLMDNIYNLSYSHNLKCPRDGCESQLDAELLRDEPYLKLDYEDKGEHRRYYFTLRL